MSLLERAQEFLVGRMLKKGVAAGVVALASSKLISTLQANGVSISMDPDLLVGAIVAVYHAVVNWYKNRNK